MTSTNSKAVIGVAHFLSDLKYQVARPTFRADFMTPRSQATTREPERGGMIDQRHLTRADC